MLVADGVFSLSVACRVVGRLVGGAKQFLEIHAKKAGRDRHHHGRALHRRSMGQGEITGCFDDSEAPKSFQPVQNFFVHG